jgi:hypothetical protein
MGPIMIIVSPPLFNHHPCFGHTAKLFLIKAFAPKRPPETLVTAILPALPWLNSTGLDALILQKSGQGVGDQFRSIITPHISWLAVKHHQAF